MSLVLALALVAGASMAIRLIPIALADRWHMPKLADEALRHAGVGALAALTLMEAAALFGIDW